MAQAYRHWTRNFETHGPAGLATLISHTLPTRHSLYGPSSHILDEHLGYQYSNSNSTTGDWQHSNDCQLPHLEMPAWAFQLEAQGDVDGIVDTLRHDTLHL